MVTQQVFYLYNIGMKQLLMYLCEKTLQERQQALVLEFHGKGITRMLIVVFISEGKESCSSTNTTID